LRIVTHQENSFNRKKSLARSSKFKGVCWSKRESKWRSYIQINGKEIYLGLFFDEVEAAKTYDEAAKKLFGEFACTNF
jgi:AP2 domain